ncbi:hypothetical protein RISK_001863 [Rhodopirellula islandica]|uniref:Uncharacterized protein n=1 Tax=Rhodopirellula islandica TaxID=595434 RepID=A0A0J1BHK5_RHOIS|nr:hypothetical protein RISK_001863 [Rhodopirellula islandica]
MRINAKKRETMTSVNNLKSIRGYNSHQLQPRLSKVTHA